MRSGDDLTGRRFGKLTVISQAESYASPSGVKRHAWNCVCDCGNRCVVRSDYLRSGQKLHCRECPPPPKSEIYDKMCRNCARSTQDHNGKWICEKDLNIESAVDNCIGYICGEKDKVTGVKHRKSACFVCGEPVYSANSSISIYCEKHRACVDADKKMIDEAPFELLLEIIAGIFARARDDYIFDTDGNREDAKKFFQSKWAGELSLWSFNADETINALDEEIKNELG